MEMTGLDLTTFSITPTVLQTQSATLNEVPASSPRHVWLPYLEDYLYTENENKGKNVQVGNFAATDILYDQVVQMDEFDGEAIQKFSNSSEQSDSFLNGVTMEVLNSGKQASPKENTQVGSATSSRNTASSPKTLRKVTLPDSRRRREKANVREKQRIVVMKNAMNVLKNTIPAAREKNKITKLEVLQLAQDYINSLRAQLMQAEEPVESASTSETSDLFVYCNSAP